MDLFNCLRSENLTLIDNTDTNKDRNAESEQVWLEYPGHNLRKVEVFLYIPFTLKSQKLESPGLPCCPHPMGLIMA